MSTFKSSIADETSRISSSNRGDSGGVCDIDNICVNRKKKTIMEEITIGKICIIVRRNDSDVGTIYSNENAWFFEQENNLDSTDMKVLNDAMEVLGGITPSHFSNLDIESVKIGDAEYTFVVGSATTYNPDGEIYKSNGRGWLFRPSNNVRLDSRQLDDVSRIIRSREKIRTRNKNKKD